MKIYKNDENWRFPCPGIYGITYNEQIIYIGQSKDIEERLEQHFNTNSAIRSILAEQEVSGFGTKYDQYTYKTLSMYCFITAHYNKIGFVVLAQCPIEELDEWEKAFIKEYKPRFNWGGVDVPFHSYKEQRYE